MTSEIGGSRRASKLEVRGWGLGLEGWWIDAVSFGVGSVNWRPACERVRIGAWRYCMVCRDKESSRICKEYVVVVEIVLAMK
jgi:hypothetical protein